MGEKKFRSEEARINYEKQEKMRLNAAKRKAFAQKKAEVSARCKAWLKENKKQAAAMAAAAIVVIVLIWLGCKWFVGPDGSLPNFFGHVRGVEDSWVVTDLNPRTNRNTGSSNVDNTKYSRAPRYFHLATLEPLEGYTQNPDYTMNVDLVNQDQSYISDDESRLARSVYVFGIANKTAEKHVADMKSVMSMSEVHSEIMKGSIQGFDVQYVYFVYDQDPNENGEVTHAYASLCLCIDTSMDACVLVVLNSDIMPKTEIPVVEDMLAQSEMVLKNLTVY